MGVTEEEANEVQKDAIPDMRILGFKDEEKRLRLKKFSTTLIGINIPTTERDTRERSQHMREELLQRI
ncbi:unnamed protein product [Eruca vesicaria subsp. sativa]|uniref:Uncharacterized protein n=1 Tax=Eruca vesicaria subsp. sativa TaxID=29727 RepID=A0ABC8JGA0_ERUVS|nr:unnamed protein product [Eruca vesicaria subsp. sativa]